MRERMNFIPGYGASPSAEPEHVFDLFTAREIMSASTQIRMLTEEYTARVARIISANDLWADDLPPSWTRSTDPRIGVDEERAAHLQRHFINEIDDLMHQDKLAEADEMT